jgi:hypothetical protein
VLRRSVLFVLLTAAGCARGTLPYPITSVAAREEPVHKLRVAVVPFVDARDGTEGSDDAEAFEYRGVELQHTDLDEVRGALAITEAVARHLAASRIFSQIILVDRASDAPEADLVLSAHVKRARGYVEAKERKKESKRPLDERTVMAEVHIAGLELREAKAERRLLVRSDFGWSILEERKAVPEPPSPWAILSEALYHANDQLAASLATADLSGAYVVRDKVALETATATTAIFGSLERSSPPGWTFALVKTGAVPLGWRGAASCEEAAIADRQTRRFHRALGPYQPTVRLWACDGKVALSYDALTEFPSHYLGRRGEVHYFSLSLGENNWPKAEAQIGAHLGLTPPSHRHTFEVTSP